MDRVDLEAGLWALSVGRWTVRPSSFYDEEAVDGWLWEGPNGEEEGEPGDWNDLPTVPDKVVEAYQRWR